MLVDRIRHVREREREARPDREKAIDATTKNKGKRVIRRDMMQRYTSGQDRERERARGGKKGARGDDQIGMSSSTQDCSTVARTRLT